MNILRVLHVGTTEPPATLTNDGGHAAAEYDMSVVTAATAAEGLRAYDAEQADCLVIEPPLETDIVAFLEDIRERDPELPVLLFASPTDIDMVSTVLAAGADYVPKTDSDSQDELLAARIETLGGADGEQHSSDPWRQSTAAISRLYSITTQSELSFTEKLDRALAVGTAELGYPFAYATRIEDGSVEVLAVAGNHEDISVGKTTPLSDNYCQLTMAEQNPVAIGNAGADEALSELPVYAELGLECYIGAPITVDGEVYGSLCFAGTEPRDPELIEAQKLTVKTLAQWVGYELERSQREEELERQVERLEEFSNIVSHDLRNPLNVAQGRLEIAQNNCDSRHLATVIDALDRMEDIIEDTLTLARQGQSVDEIEAVEIGSLIEDCWEFVESPNAELRVVDTFTVHGDPNRLSHIFENLFRNSIEHSGGHVTIRIGLKNVMYTSTRAPDSGTFGFYVEDDGPGIPEGRRESVFDAGETTRKDGTGFGLSIVKQTAEAHGWEIELTEAFDGGARFEFTNVR